MRGELLLKNILVIDDDIELCELLADYLEPEGFEVEKVYDSQQGIDRTMSGEHSLVAR